MKQMTSGVSRRGQGAPGEWHWEVHAGRSCAAVWLGGQCGSACWHVSRKPVILRLWGTVMLLLVVAGCMKHSPEVCMQALCIIWLCAG